jgi:hypothetical protein
MMVAPTFAKHRMWTERHAAKMPPSLLQVTKIFLQFIKRLRKTIVFNNFKNLIKVQKFLSAQ